jgi:methylphosphotriester-DNA--protein-cysteine methyltransferase
MGTFTCKRCRQDADLLEEFPGRVCLACWAQQEDAKPLPTAEEITRLWTSPTMVRRTSRRKV